MARVLYADSLEVPAATTWGDPAELVFPLPVGTIVEWHVHGAPEHQHQVSMAVYHLEHRVFPEGETEYFYPSGVPAVFQVEVVMTPGIPHVTLRAANTDDTYAHTIYLAVTVETGTLPHRMLERVWNLMLGRGVGG